MFRSFTTFLFWFLDKPDTWQAYAVCVSIVVASVVETITMDTIFYKNLPQETRGVFNGLYSFSGQFGILIFSLLCGRLVAFGQKIPFILLGISDFTYALIFTVFIFFEYRKK